MKKKVALLLAIIMVFSMLPMNVFGDAPQAQQTQPRVIGQYTMRPDAQWVTFAIPLNLIQNRDLNDVRLVLTLADARFALHGQTGDGIWGGDVPAGGWPEMWISGAITQSSFNQAVGVDFLFNPATAPFVWMERMSYNQAYVRFTLDDDGNPLPPGFSIPQGAEGEILIRVPAIVNHPNARLTAYVHVPGAANTWTPHRLFQNWPLVQTTQVRAISFSRYGERNFEDRLQVDRLRVHENTWGNFQGLGWGDTDDDDYEWYTIAEFVASRTAATTTPMAICPVQNPSIPHARPIPNPHGQNSTVELDPATDMPILGSYCYEFMFTHPNLGFGWCRTCNRWFPWPFRGVGGALGSEGVIIRLEAPVNYTWANVNNMEVHAERSSSWPGEGTGMDFTVQSRWERVGREQERHVLYVSVDTAGRQGLMLPERLEIRNLDLVADRDNAPWDETISVHMSTINPVTWGTTDDGMRRVVTSPAQPVLGVHQITSRPYTATPDERNDGNRPRLQATSIVVGTRRAPGMAFTTAPNTDIPTIASGILEGTGAQAVGQLSAILYLRELQVDSWARTINHRVLFTFPEGVTATGVEFSHGLNATGATYVNADPRVRFDRHNGPTGSAQVATSDNAGNFWRNRASAIPSVNFATGASVIRENVRITPAGVEVTIPNTRPHLNMDTLGMYIRFELSVEAGWAARNGDTIYVTICETTRGLDRLPEAQWSIPAAYVVDPFSLRMVTGVTELETNPVGVRPNVEISDIEITVRDPHMLNIGDTFRITMQGLEANQILGLNLYANPAVTSSADSLVLGPVRWVTAPAVGGVHAPGFLEFTIVRVPPSHLDLAYETITLTGVRVTGNIVPDVEFHAVLSGTAVAGNRIGSHPIGQFPDNLTGFGLFGGLPYTDLAVVYYTGMVADDGTSTNFGGQGNITPPPQHREFRLVEGVPFGGVAEPLIWHIVGPNRVGMVSMRAFAVMIGADPDEDIVWNSTDRVAEVRGVHFDGVTPIGIAVQMGNTNATVVHGTAAPRTVDIATAVGELSGPAGTVQPLVFNDHVYLPLRFMAETFGYTVERQGNVVIFR